MEVDEKHTVCPNCGAPRTGVIICEYCSVPLVDNLEEQAIPCWSCKTWNQWESTSCVKCGSTLTVPCLKCHEQTPQHLGRCVRCGVAL